MDWTIAFEYASDYWKEGLSDLSLLCGDDRKNDGFKLQDSKLDPKALSPQPRSLASSEFSEQNSFGLTENVEWSTGDDATLMRLVTQNNYDWKLIAKAFPKYSKVHMQRRWEFLASKNSKNYFWTKVEDELIQKMYVIHNGNWKKISEFFPGRSIAALKNRFYGVLKKRTEKKNISTETESGENFINVTTGETLSEENIDLSVVIKKSEENMTGEQKRAKINQLYTNLLLLQQKINNAKKRVEEVESTLEKKP